MQPTVYALKYFMQMQSKVRSIGMYIDLHGHSRKYNVFMYGCDDKKKPKPQVRSFPRFFSMHSVGKKYVSFADCSFHVKKGREATARVVVARELNIPLSFTLEATFCGSNYGPLKHCHMNVGHLQEVGSALCDAILHFALSDTGKSSFGTLLMPSVPSVPTGFGSTPTLPSSSQYVFLSDGGGRPGGGLDAGGYFGRANSQGGVELSEHTGFFGVTGAGSNNLSFGPVDDCLFNDAESDTDTRSIDGGGGGGGGGGEDVRNSTYPAPSSRSKGQENVRHHVRAVDGLRGSDTAVGGQRSSREERGSRQNSDRYSHNYSHNFYKYKFCNIIEYQRI